MKNTPIYISTCDKTKHVLKPAIMLMEKYWNFEKQVKVIGYNDDGITLPVGYLFLAMKPSQEAIKDWAKDICAVLKFEASEHVIFMLDDMLQIDSFNMDIFNVLIEKCRVDKSIVRACLGQDLASMECKEIAKFGDCTIVEKLRSANYWHSTQPSIWRTDYLLKVLQESTDPWDFEANHSVPVGLRMLGTRGRTICFSQIETALSKNHPGKFNILGIKLEDVKWLIKERVLSVKELQFGQKPGIIPQFTEYGFDFTLAVLKNFSSPQIKGSLYQYYLTRYGKQY